MLCWSKQMACMMCKGGLNTYWECFSFLANVNEYCWLDVMNSILYDLNYRKTLYLWCWKLILWWVVILEQAGGLHGVIRWFKFILKVFLISCKCEWNLLISSNCVPLFDFNICKYCTYDVCDWFCGGLLYWSKRMACMVL